MEIISRKYFASNCLFGIRIYQINQPNQICTLPFTFLHTLHCTIAFSVLSFDAGVNVCYSNTVRIALITATCPLGVISEFKCFFNMSTVL